MAFNLDEHKSPNDTKRLYRYFTLPNGIEVVVVRQTDPEKQKAAAAMSVNAGSICDPGKFGGLAHYLEHMLFMGSEKYPGEDEFEEYLSSHGGYSNAFTEYEYTCYYFEVTSSHLEKGLDMFSGFFNNPLMKQDSSDRELQAIESEFRRTMNSDDSRLEQLYSSLATPKHPWNKFTWGNLKSLKEDPGKEGIDLYPELRKFFEEFYTTNNMRLCVCAHESLDNMEQWVRNSFACIPSRPGPPIAERMQNAGLPLPAGKTPSLIKIRPIKDMHKLSLSWQFPPQVRGYLRKSSDYLSHLLGYEGEGSVLCLLRKEGLATSLSAGISEDGTGTGSITSIFDVSVSLTLKGVEQWKRVIAVLVAFLGLMREQGPQEWIYKELKTIADMNFRFQEEQSVDSLVEELSVNMLPSFGRSKEHLLNSHSLYSSFDEEDIKELSKILRLENSLIMFMSSVFGRTGQAKEQGEKEGGSPKKRKRGESNMSGSPSGPDSEFTEGDDDSEGDDMEDDEDSEGEDEEENEEEETAEDLSAYDFGDLIPSSEPEKEKWFGVEYWDSPLDTKAKTEVFSLAESLKDTVHLPKPNEFLSSDFSLVDPKREMQRLSRTPCHHFSKLGNCTKAEKEAAEKASKEESVHPGFPSVPLDRQEPEHSKAEIWVLADSRFKLPVLTVRIGLWHKICAQNVRNTTLQTLMVWIFRAWIEELVYPAKVAGLDYCVNPSPHGLELTFQGWSHKIMKLVEFVMKRLMNFDEILSGTWKGDEGDSYSPEIFDKFFESCLEQLVRRYGNEEMKPVSSADSVRKSVLIPAVYFRGLDKKEALSKAAGSKDSIVKFWREAMKSGMFVQSLLFGNSKEETHQELEALLKKEVKGLKKVKMGQPYSFEKCLAVEPGHSILLQPNQDPSEPNSVLQMYWQIAGANVKKLDRPTSLREIAICRALEAVMEEPLFDSLRTKQQLGYYVHCSVRVTGQVAGFTVVVQSAVAEPDALLDRVYSFLKQFREDLVSMPSEKFSSHMVALANAKAEPNSTVREESSSFWTQISQREYHWHVSLSEAQHLRTLTKDEVLAFFDSSMLAPSSRCLTVACVPPHRVEHQEESLKKHGQVVKKIKGFCEGKYFHDAFC